MKIGYRTLKTAIGAAIAILIAEQLGLRFPSAAGVIAILCIQVTRKRSVSAAVNRLLASWVGLLLSFVFFSLLGYHPLTLMLLLLVFLPVLVKFKITDGFVSSVVVLLHIYSMRQFTPGIVLNEVCLMLIGVGVALLMNLYMPNIEKELQELQKELEQNFAKILREFAFYLRHGSSDWAGQEMIDTDQLLEKAMLQASRDEENKLLKPSPGYYQYFFMRSKQFEILQRMLPIVSSLNQQLPQGQQIAEFLEKLSDHVHPGNTAFVFLQQLQEMQEQLKRDELPKTREEFEIRAALFYLLYEMQQYLFIKHSMGKAKQEKQAQAGC
ncbi:aromatic acid exporter family protein [Brevibacillus fulvus]|uniref:Uncharacterized membrane protein YgaE (UPF0421/DUF939 family) n=1 Tax=Brevibacillus fulvus TaxID=1125967 RepID=A0A939BSP6_9BACL|nr:aromatic acid exporter family protein [Brevibacillus fulvus]MBM7590688.1 uncharacterized membrane protein YgaE (UPF0421/DUF939 family) [Brevibacillus fulvus]